MQVCKNGDFSRKSKRRHKMRWLIFGFCTCTHFAQWIFKVQSSAEELMVQTKKTGFVIVPHTKFHLKLLFIS